MHHKVDILLPVFNAQDFLSEALDSIRSQSYEEWQLLIIDDGSTDNSLNIIKQYADIDNRIVFKSRENQGLVSTLNELVKWSNAPLIARMDADDICDVDKLKLQVEHMSRNPEVDIVGCWVRLFGTKEEVWHYRCEHEQIRVHSLFGQCSLLHASLLCKRAVFECYPFNSEYIHLEDFDFLSRIIIDNQFRMAAIRKALYYYRQHGDSVVYQNVELRKKKREELFNKHLNGLGFSLNKDEFDLFNKFSNNSDVSLHDMKGISGLLEAFGANVSKNFKDDNKELNYRWYKFCHKNLPEHEAIVHYNSVLRDESFTFL